MAKAILLCGLICSGKTTYAKALRKERSALVLCVDDITLALGDALRNETFDVAVERTKTYLMQKSLEVLDLNIDVILDWGFWSRAERDAARAFYAARRIPCELHYLCTNSDTRRRNIDGRNASFRSKDTKSYFVDDGLLNKCDGLFEAPTSDEADVLVTTDPVQGM